MLYGALSLWMFSIYLAVETNGLEDNCVSGCLRSRIGRSLTPGRCLKNIELLEWVSGHALKAKDNYELL